MFTGTHARIVMATPLLAFAVLRLATPISPAPAPSSVRACQAVVADTILAGQRAVPAVAKLGQEIGDSVSASLPAESNVSVMSAKAGSEPRTVDLMINAQAGLPGDWKLTLKGTAGSCIGTLTVTGPKKPAMLR